MEKYLNLEGLTKFKEELEKLRLADKLELTGALNDLNGDIGNGTFTVKRNNVTVGSFSANQKTNDEINIVVPTSISDLGQTAITEILNLINYGLLDVSDLTEELKEALHESTLDNSDFVDETSLSTELANYGKIINYDSSTKMIQLKNGNTVLSQFSAQDFLVDGMLEDVRITNGTGDNAGKSVLLIDFNTESGITDIEIPLELIFNANNYYTKTEIDNAGFLTQHQDISGKADKSEMSITSANGTATIQLKSGTSVNVLTQHQDISGKANSADLAEVAISGSYNDLSNKPDLSQYLTQHLDISGKANSADLATVATSGSYNDLSDKPTIPSLNGYATELWIEQQGYLTLHLDISGKADSATTLAGYGITDAKIENGIITLGSNTITPLTLHQSLTNYQLKSEAFSGDYNDLDNKPTIPTKTSDLTNDSNFLTQHQSLDGYATESYVDDKLEDVLGINAEGVSALKALTEDDDKATGLLTAIGNKANSADLATVATSGSYNDLSDKPTIPKLPNLANRYDYIEIAGIKWATMNVGANSITDTGLYFQWGDIQGYTAEQVGSGEGQKYFGWEDYKYGDSTSEPDVTDMTKYNSVDGKTVLDASDDAVTAAWGGKWRMPTVSEWQALGEAVNSAWTADYQGSGVSGLVLTDKTDSSKVLFFPAVGYCYKGSVDNVGSNGGYWSSSLDADFKSNAYYVEFESNFVHWDTDCSRYFGFSVRGILDDSNTSTTLHKVALSGDYEDLENKPIALPASDVSVWAKASSKPVYTYEEIEYVTATTSDNGNTSGIITIDGTKPLTVLTLTGDVSSLDLASGKVPEAGHSAHVIMYSATACNVSIAHDATIRVCPNGSDGMSISIVAGGYAEVDFLNAGGKIFVRGV